MPEEDRPGLVAHRGCSSLAAHPHRERLYRPTRVKLCPGEAQLALVTFVHLMQGIRSRSVLGCRETVTLPSACPRGQFRLQPSSVRSPRPSELIALPRAGLLILRRWKLQLTLFSDSIE
jgi:hypothetical protein